MIIFIQNFKRVPLIWSSTSNKGVEKTSYFLSLCVNTSKTACPKYMLMTNRKMHALNFDWHQAKVDDLGWPWTAISSNSIGISRRYFAELWGNKIKTGPYCQRQYLPPYKSPTALSHMHHLTCGISSLFHSVDLILLTVLLVHLILRISPHRSHHLRYHHLSLPLPSTPNLKPISFTNPFLHSHSYSFRTDFTDLNLYWIKGALFCFSFWPRVLD